MKHRSKIRWDLVLLMIVLLLIFLSSVGFGRDEIGPEELVLPISYSEIILHPDEMLEELEFIIQTLEEVHPFYEYKENRQFFKGLSDRAREKITEPMSRQDFYLVASHLVNFLDAQTHLWFQHEDRHLPLKLRWVRDGIVVTDVINPYLPIVAGDEVIDMGGLRPKDLLDKLRNLIPFDNEYRIYALGERYLTAGYVLDNLGLISDQGQVKMTLEKSSGERYTVQVPWELVKPEETAVRLLGLEPQSWFDWYVKENEGYALFRLDLCKNTDELVEALDQFFLAVQTTGVHNVVLDLRNNPGGDLDVVDSFLTYFPAQVIKYPIIDVRYSKQARKLEGYSAMNHFFMSIFQKVWDGERAVLRPKDRKLVFEGNTFVLTSNRTFAEANLLATILSDNDLVQTIGEPTGNSPSSFGGVLEFYTPNLNFYLTVSFKKFTRPNQEKAHEDTLVPDHLVPTTIQDLRLGRDPQVEWVKNYYKRLGL